MNVKRHSAFPLECTKSQCYAVCSTGSSHQEVSEDGEETWDEIRHWVPRVPHDESGVRGKAEIAIPLVDCHRAPDERLKATP